MHAALAPDTATRRWLQFVEPRPRRGTSRVYGGVRWEFADGEWRGFAEVEAPRMSRADELTLEYARMQRERVTDFSDVLPEQYAQEVPDGRGGTRVDYVGVPIKNADGTLNKYGKALIEAHETPNRRESELAQELNAVKADAAGDE